MATTFISAQELLCHEVEKLSLCDLLSLPTSSLAPHPRAVSHPKSFSICHVPVICRDAFVLLTNGKQLRLSPRFTARTFVSAVGSQGPLVSVGSPVLLWQLLWQENPCLSHTCLSGTCLLKQETNQRRIENAFSCFFLQLSSSLKLITLFVSKPPLCKSEQCFWLK